jgi:SAM-dependent methyltransferase
MGDQSPGKTPLGPLAREQKERFEEVYSRDESTYGVDPSPELASFLAQRGGAGRALDLGAGLGRDSIALAGRGFHVTAVDLSPTGIERLREQVRAEGLSDQVEALAGDLRHMEFPAQAYAVIVAATVLDHMPLEDAVRALDAIERALERDGVFYVEVHTTEDPGSPVGAGSRKTIPASETRAAVVHYFFPNELLRLLAARFRVLFYEERLEWDTTHGRPHEHGKAVALCVPHRSHPPYFGHRAQGLHRK